LRETGFFNYEPVEINGVKIRPVDVTAKLLFPKWKLKPGEEEFTVMRIRMEGEENGVAKSYEYNLLDRTEKSSGTLSMARTTGYTCTAVAHLVADGKFNRKGICPPEYLGEDEANFNFISQYLEKRGVHYAISSK
jgi:saccharopine dehydrogenase-like NADP-dependent oxidoreductase